MSKNCVIVQGPTHDYERVSKSWESFDLIYSTWEGEEKEGYRNSDCVLFNKQPLERGRGNINLQIKSSLEGLSKADKEGYEFCLKWRSDYIPKNGRKFFSILDRNKLNFIAWSDHDGGYLIDYFFAGKTKWLIEIFKETEIINKQKPDLFPEAKITEATLKLAKSKNIEVNYILPQLTKETQCFFIREGADYNSSCLCWKNDNYWDNSITNCNKWP
tara:strand:+ start:337 stop:984 length:648 start_codon:yes stop_codon:yes gene_type:complete